MKRNRVTFDYKLTNDRGEVLDESFGDEPLSYVEGADQIIAGLEKRMKGLKVGDKKEIQVPAAEAYGVRDERMMLKVDRKEFPDPAKLEVGVHYEIQVSEGYFHPFRVTEIGTEQVMLDGNHELAGFNLTFAVEVREVREATAEELKELEEHEHGPGCNH